MSVMTGYFNAQIGKGKNGFENIIGTRGESERNTEEESLLDTHNTGDWVIQYWFKKGEAVR